jgi:hypothetical protein
MELTINEVEINFAKDGEMIYIPIKPICEVLGIDHSVQYQVIKSHPVLGSTVVEKVTVAADGKDRKMVTLPLKYFFGWLFCIDARKVKPEAAEQVIKYQEMVYNIIYDKFFLEPVQQKKKLIMILEQENKLLALENERKELNAQIKTIKEKIEEIKVTSPNQLTLPFGE